MVSVQVSSASAMAIRASRTITDARINPCRIIWMVLAILPILTIGWVVESAMRGSEAPTYRSIPATMLNGSRNDEGQSTMYKRVMARRGSFV